MNYEVTVSYPDPVEGEAGDTVQLTVMEDGVDVTADSGTSYSVDDTGVATIDAPTLTGISPATISRNDSSVAFTLTGTNARTSGQALQGLPSGVAQSGFAQASSTTWTVSLSASGSATLGVADVYIGDADHGDSETASLTVTSSSGITTLPITSGNVLRMHAEAGVTETTGVSTWIDQSPTGATFSQATTTNQPSYIPSAYNGKHCLRFDGTKWLLTAANIAAMNPTANFTIYVAQKTNAVDFNDRFVLTSNDSTATRGYGISACDHNEQYSALTGNGSTTLATVGGSASTSLHLIMVTYNSSSHTVTVLIDGTSLNSNNFTVAANTTDIAAIGTANLAPGTSIYSAKCDLCEILMYNTLHSSTDLATMRGYFQTEWGTP